MNIKEGLKRIYIVISALWCLFWLIIGTADKQILISIFIGLIIPILVYFILCWIIKGFKE